MITELPYTVVPVLKGEANISVVSGASRGLRDYIFNVIAPEDCPLEEGGVCSGHPALRDPVVRRAMAHAIDTRALLSVIPVPHPRLRRQRIILGGETPNPVDLPTGCRFHPRCPVATARCREVDPGLVPLGEGHQAACLLLGERPFHDAQPASSLDDV